MPTVFTIHGIRVFFYSNDHLPIHVHVEKAGARAKILVQPHVVLVENDGFSPAAIKKILKLITEAQEIIIEAWEDHFNV